MTQRRDPGATLPWMRRGTRRLLSVVDQIAYDDLYQPSSLPGWTRAHVVGHLARNAEALTRLATWARTGVETPMYRDSDQRAAEIEAAAALPPSSLRSQLADTAQTLDDALDALDERTWSATVRSALGRTIPAAEIPWMRTREVWLHAIDLATGLSFADLPPGVVDLLLEDTVATHSAREGCPSRLLVPTDRDRTWQLGPTATVDRVTGFTAATLTEWLTGRTRPDAGPTALPALPAWL